MQKYISVKQSRQSRNRLTTNFQPKAFNGEKKIFWTNGYAYGKKTYPLIEELILDGLNVKIEAVKW